MLTRDEVNPFNEKQIELVTTFANQAVIAIENVRLFNETKETLERQTATAEILGAISGSPTDTQPVFDAIVQSGLKLFPGAATTIVLPDGDQMRAVAIADKDLNREKAWRRRFPAVLDRTQMHGTAILDSKVIDFADVKEHVTGPMAPGARNFLASGYRAITIMPMIRGKTAIGAISVVRVSPGPLSEKQRELLKTFAAQAVIAIENTRLLNELRESCCSSRPPQRMFSRLSAARLLICRRCSIRWSSWLFACARRNVVSCFVVTVKSIRVWLTITIRANSGNFTKVIPSCQDGGPPWVVWRSKAKQFKLSTFLAIRSTHSQKHKNLVKAGRLWRFPFCVKQIQWGR